MLRPELVKIKKDGFYGKFWVEEKEDYELIKLEGKNLVSCLKLICKIDKDVILKNIVKSVNENYLLENIIGFYNGSEDLIKEYNLDIINNAIESSSKHIEYLEIYWYTYNNPNIFELSTEFRGKGYKGLQAKFSEKGTEYLLDFIPSRELALYSVRLNKNIKIYSNDLKDSDPFLESKKEFTLLNILDAIYEKLNLWQFNPVRNKFGLPSN